MRRYLIALLGAIAIGSVGIWIKLIGAAVPIMTVNFLRVFLAAVFLLVVGLIFKGKIFKLSTKEVFYYIVMGLLIGAAMSIFNTVFHYLTISETYVLDSIFPFFVLILGGHFLRDGIRMSDVIALMIGALALIILNPMSFSSQTGVGLMFIEVVLYSLMIIYMRRQGVEYTLKTTFWMFLFASLFLLPFPISYGFGSISTVWLWVVLLGFGATGIGYICFNHAVSRIKTEEMSISLILGSTLFAIITAVAFFGDVLSWNMMIGTGLLLFAGTFLLWMRAHGRGKLAKIIYYAGEKRPSFFKKK